ncbi:MAG TPA: thiamine phosphate synthase [Pyrinomonadaceae bacterium]|jgi:thiamine-phosphate pyrophosphorylase
MPNAVKPLIYFISDGSIDDQNYHIKLAQLLQLLSEAVSANIPFAQLREKQLSPRRLLDLERRAVSVTRGSRTKLLINDRFDVALAAGADGVHLTSTSVRADVIRGSVSPGFVIGVSTHSIDEVRQAADTGADLIVFGPVFDTPSKGVSVGLEALSDAVRGAGDVPVLALGGIDRGNYHDVLARGAAGFAAIRFLNDLQNLARLRAEFNL